MKKKRLFGILLSLALMLTMVLALTMTVNAVPPEGPFLYISNAKVPINEAGSDTDAGWSYVPKTGTTPATLTLNGVTVSEGQTISEKTYGIYFEGTEPLKIVLVSGTESKVGVTVPLDCAIYSNGDIVIEGGGTLRATGTTIDGISATGHSITINNGTVIANGNQTYSDGEGIDANSVTINGGTVVASGYSGIYSGTGVTIKLGNVEATGYGNRAAGIYSVNGNITIEGGSVTGAGAGSTSSGIFSLQGDIVIESSNVTATSTNNVGIYTPEKSVTIRGGEVNASGKSGGILSIGPFTIDKGKVTASGNGDDSYGIKSFSTVTINDGEVTATCEGNTFSYGISCAALTINGGKVTATGRGQGAAYGISAGHVTIKGNDVTAVGDSMGIGGIVINAIKGTGWTDVDGKQGEQSIAVSTEGKELADFRKVQFVTDPEPTPTPKPTPAPVVNNAPVVNTTAKTTTRATTIKWTWNAVDGASKYKVAYHKVGSKKWKVKTTKKTKYVLKGQKIKGLYEYKVAAVTASGDVWSDTSCRYFKTVKARAKFSKGALKVSWKKDKGAAGYEIFIARNKKMDGAQVIQVAPTSKSYSVTGLEKGRYYVKVRPMKNYNGVTYTGILCKARKVKVK